MTTSTHPVTQTSYTTFAALFACHRYPAGETHTALRPGLQLPSRLTIEAPVTGFETLGQLLTANRILRRNRIEAEWFVPYFPFARHDRRNHPGDGLELEVALEMVANLELVIADPHSDVAGQLLHIPQKSSVERFAAAGLFDNEPIVVIPDAGATKKVLEWAPDLAPSQIVQAVKHRNPTTGQLSGFGVLADDLGGRPCLIVDDICDGGGTFLGLARELQAKNAGPLSLAVTHGLFTRGTDDLRQSFERIVTFGFATDPSPAAGVDYLPFHDLYTKGARR